MKDKIRIHLADDHQVLIDGMSTLLNTVSDFEVIYSLMAVLSMMMSRKANILILDISMPKKRRIAVIKEFAKGYPVK
jgi:DNA-binding NarL/FixJ family response regulator